MKKHITSLILSFLTGIILSSCHTQKPELAFANEHHQGERPTETQKLILTDTPPPTNIPDATSSFTPEPNPLLASATPTILATTIISTSIKVEHPTGTTSTTRITEIDQMEQIYIPPGEFIIGSSDNEAQISNENGRAYLEIPLHTLYLDGYWIDKYEVTNQQYALCVDTGTCQAPYLNTSETRPRSYYDNPEFATYPVIWVSWHMARTYCEWASRRLPTEAEWEKAARGTDGQRYPWGDGPVSGEYANFCDKNCPRTIANYNYDDGYADTAPVGSYPAGASPYGVMDMSGNVWEWTSTIIKPYPYDPNDGRENLDDINAERVWRGGPWSNGYWWIRSSVRYRSIPTYWYVNLGFRCASSK